MEDLLDEEKVGSWSVVLHAQCRSFERRGHLESWSKAYYEGADNLGAESLFVLPLLQGDLTTVNLTGGQ